MELNFDNFKWTREPASFEIKGDTIEVVTAEKTDMWQRITIRLENHTFALIRQVECIALVRSYKSMPINEFDSIARPLIMK